MTEGGRRRSGRAYVPGVPTVPHPRHAALSVGRPHPTGDGVVGTYVHAYEPFRPPSSQIPSMRPAQDVMPDGQSATSIYDALYSEYRRSFRTLPGDRSGEEDLVFRAFGTPVGTGLHGQGHSPRHAAHPVAWSAQHHHVPAALPPGPRRGL